MRIVRSEDAELGRILYDLEAQEYDGAVPVKKLWIDGRILWSFADHSCIAEALFLHSYVSGPINFSTNCMPFTASDLRNFFAPRFVPINTQTLVPSQPPLAANVVAIGSARTRDNGFFVELAPDAQFRTVFDMAGVRFASNLRTLLRPGEAEHGLALALTILFAGNLNVRHILAERDDFLMYSTSALIALRSALRRNNINFDIRSLSGFTRQD